MFLKGEKVQFIYNPRKKHTKKLDFYKRVNGAVGVIKEITKDFIILDFSQDGVYNLPVYPDELIKVVPGTAEPVIKQPKGRDHPAKRQLGGISMSLKDRLKKKKEAKNQVKKASIQKEAVRKFLADVVDEVINEVDKKVPEIAEEVIDELVDKIVDEITKDVDTFMDDVVDTYNEFADKGFEGLDLEGPQDAESIEEPDVTTEEPTEEEKNKKEGASKSLLNLTKKVMAQRAKQALKRNKKFAFAKMADSEEAVSEKIEDAINLFVDTIEDLKDDVVDEVMTQVVDKSDDVSDELADAYDQLETPEEEKALDKVVAMVVTAYALSRIALETEEIVDNLLDTFVTELADQISSDEEVPAEKGTETKEDTTKEPADVAVDDTEDEKKVANIVRSKIDKIKKAQMEKSKKKVADISDELKNDPVEFVVKVTSKGILGYVKDSLVYEWRVEEMDESQKDLLKTNPMVLAKIAEDDMKKLSTEGAFDYLRVSQEVDEISEKQQNTLIPNTDETIKNAVPSTQSQPAVDNNKLSSLDERVKLAVEIANLLVEKSLLNADEKMNKIAELSELDIDILQKQKLAVEKTANFKYLPFRRGSTVVLDKINTSNQIKPESLFF